MNKKVLFVVILVVFVGGFSFINAKSKPVKQEYLVAIQDKILPQYPELEENYNQAMSDGVMTNKEAKNIIDLANSIKEANE